MRNKGEELWANIASLRRITWWVGCCNVLEDVGHLVWVAGIWGAGTCASFGLGADKIESMVYAKAMDATDKHRI